MSLGTVIIFARAPRLGVGKRRLARDIGRLNAVRFYRRNLGDLIQCLRRGPWNVVVAVSAEKEAASRFFRGQDVTIQAPGDLGRRMGHALRSAPPGPVLLVGSDIPGISQTDIRAGFEVLRRSDAVFGPAPDGGYWLVGIARRKPLPAAFMRGVRWSTSDALEDTRATLPSDWKVGLLSERADVDDGPSHAAYRQIYGAP